MPRFTPFLLAAVTGAACLLCGCSTTTTIHLTGTPWTTISGKYRTGDSSFDVTGSLPFVVEVSGSSLQECAFFKTDPKTLLDVEIRRGKTPLLRATAGRGDIGLRARKEGGWQSEVVR